MRIDDKNVAGLGAGGVDQARAAEAASKRNSGQGAARSGAGDEVSLSGLAEQISSQEAHSPAREARLARLAEQVALGTYEPDPAAVADGLIAE